MKILLAGQKWFGAEVFRELRKHPEVSIAAVCSPADGERDDKLTAQAKLWRVPLIPSGTLKAATMPEGVDLIVAAHSHDFISEKTRLRAAHGGIGYLLSSPARAFYLLTIAGGRRRHTPLRM